MFSGALITEAFAAEWLAEPSLSLRSTYNDNISFRPVDELDTTSGTLSVGLNSQINEQVWGVNLNTDIRGTRYSGAANTDTNNVFLKFGSHYRTELHQWQLGAGFERNTTFDDNFETQFINTELNEQTEREMSTLSPSWAWSISKVWTIQGLLQATVIKYDEVASLNLSDSSSTSAQLTSKHQLNDVTTFSVSVAHSRTERDQNKRKDSGFYEFENDTIDLSYDYQPSENEVFSLSVGRRDTFTRSVDVPTCLWEESSGVFVDIIVLSRGFNIYNCPTQFPNVELGSITDNSNDSGVTFDVSYDYHHEVSSYSVLFAREINTSSDGFAQELDNLTVRYNRRFSELFSADLLLNASKSASIDQFSNSQDLESIRVEPSITWRYSNGRNLSAGYRYREQTYLLSNETSSSNSIYVNLSFFWPKLISSY